MPPYLQRSSWKVLYESPYGLQSPSVSPQGDRVAFFESQEARGIGSVVVVDREGKRTTLGHRFRSVRDAFTSVKMQGLRWSPSGKEVRLTTGEFDLLAAFVNNANQVLTRDRLLDLARNREAGPFDRTIDVQVGRLRRKLEDDPQRPMMIKTVRGTGYIFTPPVEVT